MGGNVSPGDKVRSEVFFICFSGSLELIYNQSSDTGIIVCHVVTQCVTLTECLKRVHARVWSIFAAYHVHVPRLLSRVPSWALQWQPRKWRRKRGHTMEKQSKIRVKISLRGQTNLKSEHFCLHCYSTWWFDLCALLLDANLNEYFTYLWYLVLQFKTS